MIHYDKSYFQGEIREGFYVEEKMKRAWAAQVEVLLEIKRICEARGIPYFADWGTLLGAVRHKGFVPWDDDLDIGMLRPDYMKFLAVAEDELAPEFKVKSLYNNAGHDNVKARVYTGESMNFDKEYLERFHCCPYVVGIDIFPIDYIPRDEYKSGRQNQMIELVMSAAASVSDELPRSDDTMKLLQSVEQMTGFKIDYTLRPVHELKKIVDELSAMYTESESDEVCSMIDLAAGWDYHAKKEWYEDWELMDFEQTKIPVPAGFDGILKIKYGSDYMTPVQGGGSHDYPFYGKQESGLKEVIENAYNITLSQEQLDQLIAEKIRLSITN